MPSFWTPFGFVILGGFIAITLHYNLLCLSDLHPHRFRLPCRFHPLHQRKPNHRPSPHTCASSSLSPSPTAPLCLWAPPIKCPVPPDRKSTRLNSSHANISYAVFCLKKKKNK